MKAIALKYGYFLYFQKPFSKSFKTFMRKWFFYLLNFKIMTERELIISQSIFDF
jgi:hypothetical protein